MLTIENIAEIVHNVNKTYCEAIGDDSQPFWNDAPDWQKSSAINGVKALLENPDLSPKDMHGLWWEVKKREGWRYGPVKDATLKEHPCCLPFDQLPPAQRAKDHLFSAVVTQLLDWHSDLVEPDTDTAEPDGPDGFFLINEAETGMTKLPDHHREQSQQQLDYINAAKLREKDVRHFIEICGNIFAADSPRAAREFALARTHLEDAFMRVIRGIANPRD